MKQQITIADPDFLARLDSDLQEIKRGLKNFKVIPQDEFLSKDEFMSKTKISRWKFFALIEDGQLEFRRIGRKYYIPINQVQKFFDGQMALQK